MSWMYRPVSGYDMNQHNNLTPFQPWLDTLQRPHCDYMTILGNASNLPAHNLTQSYTTSWPSTPDITTAPCYLPLDPPPVLQATSDNNFLQDQTRPSSVLSTYSSTSSTNTNCSTNTDCTETISHDSQADKDSNNKSTKRGKKRGENYRRYPKPPYSFCGLIITAIMNSPKQRLTLSGIHSKLKELFTFFRGEYTGWRDSVRHNLSHNSCFYKVPYPCPGEDELTGKMNGRRNYWKVDMTKAPKNVFKILDKKALQTETYKEYIHEELGLPEIHIPEKAPEDSISAISENPVEQEDHSMTPRFRYSMRLPHKYCTSTDSPEQFRRRHPSLHDNTPIKIEKTDETPACKRQRLEGPSTDGEESRRATDMDELLSYVKSLTGDSTNSSDAVNNLSALCCPDIA